MPESKVHVVELERGQLGQAQAAAEEHTDDRRVAPLLVAPAIAGTEQPAQLLIPQHRQGVSGTVGGNPGHRRGRDLPLLLQPPEGLLEVPIPGGRGRRRPPFELVGDERFDVLAMDRAHAHGHPAVGQERREQASGLNVATDGLGRAVGP